jgi:hypothetical protein
VPTMTARPQSQIVVSGDRKLCLEVRGEAIGPSGPGMRRNP